MVAFIGRENNLFRAQTDRGCRRCRCIDSKNVSDVRRVASRLNRRRRRRVPSASSATHVDPVGLRARRLDADGGRAGQGHGQGGISKNGYAPTWMTGSGPSGLGYRRAVALLSILGDGVYSLQHPIIDRAAERTLSGFEICPVTARGDLNTVLETARQIVHEYLSRHSGRQGA